VQEDFSPFQIQSNLRISNNPNFFNNFHCAGYTFYDVYRTQNIFCSINNIFTNILNIILNGKYEISNNKYKFICKKICYLE